MNTTVDIIILSNNANDRLSALTMESVSSYINTIPDSVLNTVFVIETNCLDAATYDHPKVKVIKPATEFNYNKFVNIGLELCLGDYVIISNNDIVVHDKCVKKLISILDAYQDVDSLSPVDRDWECHSVEHFPNDNCLYYGFRSSYEVFGPCICCRRKKVFQTIGYLDERFFFYWQDNDYAECLKSTGLTHALFTGSRVTHKHDVNNGPKYDTKEEYGKALRYQQTIFNNKWMNEHPYCVGGYKPFREYKVK